VQPLVQRPVDCAADAVAQAVGFPAQGIVAGIPARQKDIPRHFIVQFPPGAGRTADFAARKNMGAGGPEGLTRGIQ